MPARKPESQPSTSPTADRKPRPIAEAFADPVRADLFDALSGWLRTATVDELAQFVRASPESVARQVEVLVACDLVEQVSAESAGGSPAYRLTTDALITDEEWSTVPAATRRRIFAQTLERMQERMSAALARGGFDAHDVHVSWVPLELDARGYDEIVGLTIEMLERVRDIQAAVVGRRAEGSEDGDAVKTDMMLLHFHRAAEGAAEDDAAATAPEVLDRMFALTDDLADEIPGDEPDWQRIAARATALSALAHRQAATGARA